MFSPLYFKIFEKSPFLMKTPTQNFAHHTEVKKHPFGVKTPILATLKKIEFDSELFDRASAWGVTALADLSPKIQNQ